MGLAPYPWLERPAEVLAKMLNKLPGGILIYGPRGCGVFELASRFAAAVVCQHPVDGLEEKGMSQKQLAGEIGISPSRVNDYISGRSEPTLKIARLLCRVLNIPPAAMLGF